MKINFIHSYVSRDFKKTGFSSSSNTTSTTKTEHEVKPVVQTVTTRKPVPVATQKIVPSAPKPVTITHVTSVKKTVKPAETSQTDSSNKGQILESPA